MRLLIFCIFFRFVRFLKQKSNHITPIDMPIYHDDDYSTRYSHNTANTIVFGPRLSIHINKVTDILRQLAIDTKSPESFTFVQARSRKQTQWVRYVRKCYAWCVKITECLLSHAICVGDVTHIVHINRQYSSSYCNKCRFHYKGIYACLLWSILPLE